MTFYVKSYLSGEDTEAVVAVEDVEFVFRTVMDPRRIGILEGVAGLVNILDVIGTESSDAGPDDNIVS